MDRVLKIINILLLSIVGMLLLTGVMVLVQGSKVDLGKIADWAAVLSASATAGTFYVAWLAYRKVPDWLGQKKNEDIYSLAKKLVIEDYYNALNFYQKTTIDLTTAFNNTLEKDHSTLLSSQHTFTSDVFVVDNISKTIKLIRKLGFKLTDNVIPMHNNYYNSMQLSTDPYMNAWKYYRLIKKHDNDSNSADISDIKAKFFENFKEVQMHYSKIEMHYKILIDNDINIIDYIEKA